MSTTAPLPELPPAKPGHVALKAMETPWTEESIEEFRVRLRASPPPDWRGDICVPSPDPLPNGLKRLGMHGVDDDGTYHLPPSPPDQRFRAYDVLLTMEDAERIEADALEQYRTLAQQIAFIVHSHYTKPAKAAAPTGPVIPSFIPRGVPAPPPVAPEDELEEGQTIPAYHVGDGSGDDMPFGKGCGKVGVLLTRIIKPGEMIRPGDVLTIHGTPILEGGLMCGGCGQPISPASWSTA